ncbi:WxL domain-containing protein [Bombilactobacillus thymidiniphilus]|uniref:WxL domain-containing protein n=1 Tax=Bombilactobacillus thymidiniphilus TaxID=2923363 RepID=A0ABY4PC46_9LACO|nr:WxL domain-containing protein [Bombilactobacillus thymidiniphilus]UQS83219.1 WxL domain-containing protein [Bombilactobacillus thymidiniphilus]
MKISKLLNIFSQFLSVLAIITALICSYNIEVSAESLPDNVPVDPTSSKPPQSTSGVGFATGKLGVYTPSTQNFYFGKQLQYVSRKWHFVPYSDGTQPVDNASILQNSVIVADSRGADNTGWSLSASISPFKNGDNVQDIESLNIESSTVYAVKNFYENAGDPIFESTAGMATAPSSSNVNNSNPISIKPVEPVTSQGLLKDDVPTSAVVMSADKGKGTGVWGLCFNKMNLYTGPTSGQKVGDYTATITWTLAADSTQ